MKEFEVLHKGNTQHRLTITPTKITIKIREGASMREEAEVIRFLTDVSNKPEMVECTVTFRGGCIQNKLYNTWKICMKTDSGKVFYRYNER